MSYFNMSRMDPHKSIPGSEISYTAGYYTPQHYDKDTSALKNVVCKGVESTSDGVLMVHLVDDYDTDGSKRYCGIKLLADLPRHAVFDEIKEDGTTVTEANITLYPM